MEFGYFQTPPSLAAAVKTIWYARGTQAEFAVAEPIVPDGCVELVLNLADRFVQVDGGHAPQPRHLLVGQMTRPTIAAPTGTVDLIGIRFWPGRAGAALRTPMWELQDQLIAADGVFPGLDQLADDLQPLAPAARLTHLAGALAACCARVVPGRLTSVERALRGIARSHGTIAIEQLARQTGVTTRHLERLFRNEVGLGVKQMARITRIQAVLAVLAASRAGSAPSAHSRATEGSAPSAHSRATEGSGPSALLARGQTPSGAEIAARFGYSDQAHLIHECRALTGRTPGQLTTTARTLSGLMREAGEGRST